MFGSIAPATKALFLTEGPPTPSAASALRAAIAALPLAPRLARAQGVGSAALELAVYNFGYNGLLFIGLALDGSSATKSAFFLQGSVIITPLLAAAAGDLPPPRIWAAAALALVGVALIAAPDLGASVSAADALFVGAACCWSLVVYRVGVLAEDPTRDMVAVQAAKNLALAVLYGAWAAWDAAHGAVLWPGAGRDASAVTLLVGSALAGGTAGDVLQAEGQKGVSSGQAALLLATEPLWAAAMDWGWTGHFPLDSVSEAAGCAAVLAGAVLGSAGGEER